MFTLVQIPIGWYANMGCYTDAGHEYDYLDEFMLVDDGSGDFNANVTHSVKQLSAGCVDETSVHHGFNVDNDYNIRFRTA